MIVLLPNSKNLVVERLLRMQEGLSKNPSLNDRNLISCVFSAKKNIVWKPSYPSIVSIDSVATDLHEVQRGEEKRLVPNSGTVIILYIRYIYISYIFLNTFISIQIL